MTYVNVLFLLICHITFFLELIGCLNLMIKGTFTRCDLSGRFWQINVAPSSTFSDLNVQLKLSAPSSVHIVVFCVRKVFNNFTYNGRKIVESREKSVFCYRFFSRFCESQGADASTHDRLFTVQRAKSGRQIAACKRTLNMIGWLKSAL